MASGSESISSKIVGGVLAIAALALVIDVVALGGEQIDLTRQNPVSLAAGREATVIFDVTDAGAPHELALTPYLKRTTNDTRYAFATEITVMGPGDAELARLVDRVPNHRVRYLEFVPTEAGEHRVRFVTNEGDQRADVEISVNDRRILVPAINKAMGFLD